LRRAEASTAVIEGLGTGRWTAPRRGRAGAMWIALALVNIVAIGLRPSWDSIPVRLTSIGFALLYGLLVVWHMNRRITADYERQRTDEKNARLLDTQRSFMQDATHYLRAPITIALTHAELLARNLSGRDLHDIQTVAGEIIRLRRLSERLLVIAAAEDPEFLRTEPVMLDEFTIEIIDRWRPTARRRWQLGCLDPGTVMADQERLGLAVDALLENAVRHTRDGDMIQLSVVSGDGEIRMVVTDSGGGIETGDLAYIFDRFRRGAGTAAGHGTGLGLALVRAVADAHGGTVRVRSTLGQGSEFEIVLPEAASAGAVS
jgi:signal transduction histidine kinase